MDMIKRVPITEQVPEERIKNFKEACLGYTEGEARAEASHRLGCKNPRCVAGCPVSIDIPAFLQQVIAGQEAKAAGIITESSALPAVYGRVCSQETQCEDVCICGIRDEPVAVDKLERYVVDWARKHKLEPEDHSEKSGQRVAVIGAGPAGLTCADDLAKLGYEVKIFETLREPGGVLVYGIPEFRLPEDTVAAHEVENVKRLDVEIEINTTVGKSVSVDDFLDKKGYDAVFIGSGAGLPMFMHIPSEAVSNVFSANEFLTRNNLMKAFRGDYDTPIFAGKRAIVMGDGDVAMDVAQTTLRLGAGAHIVYRRSEAGLPARVEEVYHAKKEGVIFDLLTNPVETLQDKNGWVRGVRVIHMELGKPDQSGRRRPVGISGSEEEIPADTVIMALGVSPNPLLSPTTEGLETNRKGCLVADEKNDQTTREGVSAEGDAVIGATTVILAMGAGKQVARGIDECLRSERA